jgi:carboxyvinyl-carboxyphosphonate phosphorylmutase
MTSLLSRRRFRDALSRAAAVSPASVYDPLSARIAEEVGYELGILAGSIASLSSLATPDVLIMTLTEVADLVRRIMRVSNLGLLIDADHGYGNALNVYRTIEELEHSGAAAVSIEDTLLPQPFGEVGGAEAVISLSEMLGKLKAAVAAKKDPDFVIAGRTSSLRVEGLDGAVERVRTYAAIGVDAIFVVGVENVDQVRALRDASALPIIVGPSPKAGAFDRNALSSAGAALFLQGHQPISAAAKALHDAYRYLYSNGDPKKMPDLAAKEELDRLMKAQEFAERTRRYLQ